MHRKLQPFAACWAFTVVFIVSTVLADERIAPPSTEQYREALQLVRQLFASELAGAESPTAKVELAEKLLAKAAATQNDHAGRYALLAEAKRLATEAADVGTISKVIEQVCSSFDVEPLAAHFAALKEANALVRTKEQKTALAEKAAWLFQSAIDADRFKEAQSIGEVAKSTARRAGRTVLIRKLVVQERQLRTYVAMHDAAAAAEEVLNTNVVDPRANLTAGKYRALVLGDWDGGLSLLALGPESTLRDLAIHDLKTPTTPDEQIELADGWFEQSQMFSARMNNNLASRAVYWYRKALPGVSGLQKEFVSTRLAGWLGSMTEREYEPRFQ